MNCKFKPDITVFVDSNNKFYNAFNKGSISDGDTFCVDNRVMNIFTENDCCGFFNKRTGTANDWFWGYAYNLMFEAIDFDWDSDVWLCRVLGYRG